MMRQPGETGANKIVIGWIEPGGTKRDAVDYAKGFAQRHFDSADASWYAVLPFMEGWLYEVQEGGSGKSYIPGVVKALSIGSEESWIRVGDRVMSVGLREGRPYCVLMSEDDSRLKEGDPHRLTASGKMQRVVKRGSGVLYSGLTVAVLGFSFFLGAAGFHYIRDEYPPTLREVNLELLPHKQWERVGNVPPNLFVERLELLPGEERWQTTVKPIQRSQEGAVSSPQPSPAPEPLESSAFEPVMEDESIQDVVPEEFGEAGVDAPLPPIEPISP